MKRIVIFGQENNAQEYSRNAILRKAFEDIGCRVFYCTLASGFARSDASPMFKLVFALINAPFRWIYLVLRYMSLPSHEAIYLPYPSHLDAWLACILGRLTKRIVILDAFLGLYDTIVRDRKLMARSNPSARLIWHYERLLLHAADIVFVDTKSHGKMLQNDYGLPDGQIVDVPVGIDESLWKPLAPAQGDGFTVIFWSTFIPLHGVDTVAQAAKLLEETTPEIQFLVIGKGQMETQFRTTLERIKPANLKWIDQFIPLDHIRNYVADSHCCLGIFGSQEKSQRVIPYKAYQALASSRPLITARTRTSENLFSDGVDAVLVAPDNPGELSEAIKGLAADRKRAAVIGKNGRRLYESRLSNRVIREKLAGIITHLSVPGL